MRKETWLWGMVAGVLCGGGTAMAQVPAEGVVERLGGDTEQEEPIPSVQVLGGMSSYTGDLNARTDLGVSFGASVGARWYDVLGAEVAYQGNRNSVSEDFAGPNPGVIFRHEGTLLAKAGPSYRDFFPFLGAGLGASFVAATPDAERNNFTDDFIFEFPVAAGLEYQRGRVTASLRGTYTFLVNEDFADNTGTNVGGGALAGLATLGGTF